MHDTRDLQNWLTLLEQRHPESIELGLERCGEVYRNLGCPRPAQTVYTVAGTNGKGSTVAYLAAMSAALGQRCGTYTSPHVLQFNERVSIMGIPVADELLIEAFEQVDAARHGLSLTYFEFTTLAAFLILQDAALDCAVLEVGLGGRLDTVNLVDPDCAVITPIGLDHQDFLGPDIASIAAEKAGIIRAGTPLVCTRENPPDAVLEKADRLQAPLYRRHIDFDLVSIHAQQLRFSFAGRQLDIPSPPMSGRHQRDNLAAALTGIALLNPDYHEKQDEIADAIRNCRLPGRMQQLSLVPEIILDVGHNTLAAEAVAAYLEQSNKTNVICVLAMLADKPAETVALALSPVCNRWLCAGIEGARGQAGESLSQRVLSVLPDSGASGFESLGEAMDEARSIAGEQGTILVFGSFFTVSAVIDWFENRLQHAKITPSTRKH